MTERERQETAACDLPVTGSEDVEYDPALADADDREAQERAEAADRRATQC